MGKLINGNKVLASSIEHEWNFEKDTCNRCSEKFYFIRTVNGRRPRKCSECIDNAVEHKILHGRGNKPRYSLHFLRELV